MYVIYQLIYDLLPLFNPQHPLLSKCNMLFYNGLFSTSLQTSDNNMGKSLSVILVTKVLLVATLFYNQLPHCSAQDYIAKKSEQSNDQLPNLIRVIKRSSNNEEEYPDEASNENDLIGFPWTSHFDLPKSAQPWWDKSSTSEEKRSAGNMIRMIKRDWEDKKNLGLGEESVGGSRKYNPANSMPYVWNHSLFWKRGNQLAAKRKKEANIFRLIKRKN